MMQAMTLILGSLLASVPVQQARQSFEAEFGKTFAARKAVPAGLVDRSLRSGPKASEWTFALPMDSGPRFRFAKVTFKDGKYASGTLHYFGLPEIKMTAAEFSGLRRKFPMAGVCENPGVPVCLFHPTEKSLARPVPASQANGLGFSPIDELYGSFVSNLARLQVKTEGVAFRVDFTDADGKSFSLGTVRNVRGKERLDQATILNALDGNRPELVSESARVRYYLRGRIVYVPCNPESEK